MGAGHQTGSCPPYVSSIHTSLRPGWVQSGSAWKRGNDCVGTCAALLMLPPAPQTHTTCTETDGYCLHEMTAQQQQPKKKAEKNIYISKNLLGKTEVHLCLIMCAFLS